MSVILVNISHKVKGLSLAEHSILNLLAFRADDELHECYPSIVSIKESTSADRKTIIKCLQTLCDKKLIYKTNKLAGKTKKVPVYKVTLNSPKNGTIPNSNSPTFSSNGPKNGSIKQSQKRDTERSDLKDQRKDNFKNSKGPIQIAELLAKLAK